MHICFYEYIKHNDFDTSNKLSIKFIYSSMKKISCTVHTTQEFKAMKLMCKISHNHLILYFLSTFYILNNRSGFYIQTYTSNMFVQIFFVVTL